MLAGAPEDLARELVAPSHVSFTVAVGTDRALLSEAVGGTRTEQALAAGVRITVPSDDPDATLRRLTFTRGLHATGITVNHPTLEDVYLAAVSEREPKTQEAQARELGGSR